ncbi:Nucleoporin Ndc1 [Gryllus bimaculatus]|nr:Nucleoporin Ndc1 [Gryllus bimaculatus]
MKSSLLPCILCPILYFVNGDFALNVMCDIFNLTSEDKLFSNLIDYLNFTLLFYMWLQTTVLIFSCDMVEHILNIFLTDLPEFPIACQFGEANIGTLHEVLAAYKCPVIQNWGCLDLFSLAKNDPRRRKEIFALSQPGGHPNNWNAIRKECVQLMDNFVEQLNIAISEMTNPQTESGGIPSTPVIPVPRMREMSPAMRNLCLIGQDTSLQYEPLNEEPFVGWHKIYEHVVLFAKSLIPPLLKTTRLNHIFDKFPDAQLKLIFSNSLPVINAVQGLSFLVAASLTEDEYGVVQKDLNTIIIAIQQLKLTVDRAQKIGNFKRTQKNEQNDMQMKAALKASLKRSLYKICVTYRDHIQELDLPSSVLNSLQVYLSFKE